MVIAPEAAPAPAVGAPEAIEMAPDAEVVPPTPVASVSAPDSPDVPPALQS
jgi:hypothetical protein